MSEIATVAKLNCAKRELRMRHRVYPNRVRARSMTQEQADYEIAVMEAIVADYQAARDRELEALRKQTVGESLFDQEAR